MLATTLEKENFAFELSTLEGNFFRCVRARPRLLTPMTRKSSAVGMRNAVLRNHLNLLHGKKVNPSVLFGSFLLGIL